MKYNDLYIEGKNSAKIVKALSSDVRLRILELLETEDLNIQSISQKLGLGKTTTLTHINILQESGFIRTRYVPGTIGNQKICQKVYDRLVFNFSPQKEAEEESAMEIDVPVGNYFNPSAYPPCGLATKNSVIVHWDDPGVFYDPKRIEADLLWLAYGELEYQVPLYNVFSPSEWNQLDITLEVSAQGGIINHKELRFPSSIDKSEITDGESTISFWINDTKIGTHLVKEYEKGEGGKLTPTWWKGSNYGELIHISITKECCTINGATYPDIHLDMLNIHEVLRFKLGNEPESPKKSGFNIYGEHFGNYNQSIKFSIR